MGRHHAAPARDWFTRLRALLAGGLVLGVGATVTLASWNDSEYTTGAFTAGMYDIVGSTNGVDFVNHDDSPDHPAAKLSFEVPSPGMAPGTTTYALYSVRSTEESVASTVQLTADEEGNDEGLGQYLRYGVRTVNETTAGEPPTCNATTFNQAGAETVVAPGSSLTVGATSSQPLAPLGASTLHYCFAVTLPDTAPNEAQGKTLIAHWQFVGTSATPSNETPQSPTP